jgi:hypothetical protein
MATIMPARKGSSSRTKGNEENRFTVLPCKERRYVVIKNTYFWAKFNKV